MQTLARRLLDPKRMKRLATLEAYRAGCPPLPYLAPSERKGFYAFHRVSRTNFARTIVNARTERQRIRAIRTAAANDDNGDAVAWRYFAGSGLDVVAPDVQSDRWTFSEAYVRVGLDPDGRPMGMRRDPRFCITVQDPLNPMRTLAAFELLWDEFAGYEYAYLWLPGEQWVAERPRKLAPAQYSLSGVTTDRRFGYWWPKLSFVPSAFTMRPNSTEVPDDEQDGRPYSETYDSKRVPVERFENRDGVGVYEEHLDLLDRINHTIMQRVVIAAVQAYKQRALRQTDTDGKAKDRLPDKDPETGEEIPWDDIFESGPDRLWKLPPGVDIWESNEVQLDPIRNAVTDDVKHLSSTTNTPLPLMSDEVNQSAEAAQLRREGLVFGIEDANSMDGRHWANVISMMFEMAPDEDRYAGEGEGRVDRAEVGQIVVDWYPAERYSLSEKATADASNKSLSPDMAAVKIWQLTPDEVAINRTQRASEALLAPPPGNNGAPTA